MTQKQPTTEQLELIKQQAQMWVRSIRVPIMRTPDEYGLEFKEITFPSFDGVHLKGWFIPSKGSNKLIICNHPMMFNRYGYPGHVEKFSTMSDFEVNFLPEYKVMIEAGYNVICYDQRNHGESDEGDGHVCGVGRHEWKDSVGVKQWVDAHPVFSKMTVGLMSRCMGANAQFEAITRFPELFANVKCMVAPQPCTVCYLTDNFYKSQGLSEFSDLIDSEKRKLGGFATAEWGPHPFAPAVTIPTLISQVHDDSWTLPEDVQTTYDLLGSKEKELLWIYGTTRRFDGYNYFGEHPDRMLEWYAKYM